MSSENGLYYSHSGSIKSGQVNRFVLTYTPPKKTFSNKDGTTYKSWDQSSLFLKIRNTSSLTKRAAYMMGPYILYCDVRSSSYDPDKPCYITSDQPKFEPNLQANQSFDAELSCHTIKEKYVWTVDIVSQILFSAKATVEFEVLIGKDKDKLINSNNSNVLEFENLQNDHLHVLHLTTEDLWNLPPPIESKPVHLVIITHGLHSNVGADMLYLKEEIEKMAAKSEENIIVRGYNGNICKTEKGIKYLGMKVAEYIVNDVYFPEIKKVSFIAHSLGGLIQTFAIAFIEKNFSWYFQKVQPINFITVASPLLGISQLDSPLYIQAALGFGALGRTGQELGLTPTELDGKKTLIELLPTGITHRVLEKFKKRTVYSNAINDGIVPLRTSAILFLDYKGLSEIAELFQINGDTKELSKTVGSDLTSTSTTTTTTTTTTTRGLDIQSFPAEMKNKITQTVYGIPNFMSSMSFNYLSNPILSITNETVEVNPEKSFKDNEEVTESLEHQSDSNNKIGEIPSNLYQEENNIAGSLLAPLQNTFATWIAPQGTNANNEQKHLPRPSIINTAKGILLPPLPPQKFLIEPKVRKNPVIHDKVYDEEEILKFKENLQKAIPQFPNIDLLKQQIHQTTNARDFTIKTFGDNFTNFFVTNSESEKLEEDIAMKWHTGMSWRKVLVNIDPDAHNNIIVRRRFANAYGWPVIEHLVSEHFNNKFEEEELSSSESSSVDIVDTDVMEFMIPEENDEDDWINSKNYKEDSIFEIGPAGFLSNVNDKFQNII